MPRVRPNRYRYLLSLADELQAQSTRVRDLIGDAHWYYDGHHKEYLLVELLRRHLPSGLVASRGFVISPTDSELRSKEQDVLVVDVTREAPVFNQGGVIVVFPGAVLAAISVKTTLDSRTVEDSVKGLNSVRDAASGHLDPRLIWCGAYYFEVDRAVDATPSLAFGHVGRAIGGNKMRTPVPPPSHPCPVGPDLHCSAKDFAFVLEHAYHSDVGTTVGPRLLGYRCHGLATAIFLGKVLDHVATARGASGSEFSFFADGGLIELLPDPGPDVHGLASG